MQLYAGCSGWSNSFWEGHFYPKGTEPKNYLSYYSKVFVYVERLVILQDTQYVHDKQMGQANTDNFRFTAYAKVNYARQAAGSRQRHCEYVRKQHEEKKDAQHLR